MSQIVVPAPKRAQQNLDAIDEAYDIPIFHNPIAIS
jgi:hypothetical protein